MPPLLFLNLLHKVAPGVGGLAEKIAQAADRSSSATPTKAAKSEKTYLSTPPFSSNSTRGSARTSPVPDSLLDNDVGSHHSPEKRLKHFYPHGSAMGSLLGAQHQQPPYNAYDSVADPSPPSPASSVFDATRLFGTATAPTSPTHGLLIERSPPVNDVPNALLENRASMAKFRQSLRSKVTAVTAFQSPILGEVGEAKMSELETRIGSTQQAMEDTQRKIVEMLAREEALNAAADALRNRAAAVRAPSPRPPSPRQIAVPPRRIVTPPPPLQGAILATQLVEPPRPVPSSEPPTQVEDGDDDKIRPRSDSARRSTHGYNPERFAMLSHLFEKRRMSELELAQLKVFAVRKAVQKWVALVDRRRSERKAAAEAAERFSLPPPLPSGWMRHSDSTGRTYYANAQLGKSQWIAPL
jgi:hypothetical protein